jgi:hypothetical protein
MDHSPDVRLLSLARMPGVYRRELIEAALPLFEADPPEAGLRVSPCPGIPQGEGNYHELRIKLLSPTVVDVWCPCGCDLHYLQAQLEDLAREDEKAA